jgi:hypothetical protein
MPEATERFLSEGLGLVRFLVADFGEQADGVSQAVRLQMLFDGLA